MVYKKSKFEKILIFFAALYPIIPAYFKIVGFSFPNLCCITFILLSALYRKIRFVIKKNVVVFSVLLWMVINVGIYFYHFYFFGAIWCICTVVAGMIFADNINNERLFVRILLAIVYVAGIVCMFGLIESITGFRVFSIFNTSGDKIDINPVRFGITRIVGFAYQTISYAVYLVLSGCLAFYLMTLKEYISDKERKKIKCIYVLIVINILLTLSRSAIFIFIISQVLLLWRMGMKKVLKMMFYSAVLVIIVLVMMYFIAPKVFHQLQNIYYMMMAVIDNNYISRIATEFGNDNLNAVGTRTDIYGWVYEKVKDNIWLGVGFKTPFSYEYDAGNQYHTMIKKTAIEVEYLLTLYETGIWGLLSEIIVFISIIGKSAGSVLHRFLSKRWENKLSFNYLVLTIFVCMILMYFMVNQSSEQYLLNIIIVLFIAYNSIGKGEINK